MDHFVSTILVVLGVLLIGVVLLQRGRGGGLAGAFGGLGGQSAFGTKAGDTFTRITIIIAALWVVMAGVSGLVMRSAASTTRYSGGDSIADEVPGDEAPEDDEAGIGSGDPTTDSDDAISTDGDDTKSSDDTKTDDATSEDSDTEKSDDAASSDDDSNANSDSEKSDTDSSDDSNDSDTEKADDSTETPKSNDSTETPELNETPASESSESKSSDNN